MAHSHRPKPNFLWSLLTMRCPRCRHGRMFRDPNPYRKLTLKHIFDMPDHCTVCKQKFDLEPGFWYGTGFVSYALAVIISALTFLLWWATIGISTDDNRILYWLLTNAIFIFLLYPWLMRFSRVVYLYFFIRYNPDYENAPTVELHVNEE